jgi:hypothetical protein
MRQEEQDYHDRTARTGLSRQDRTGRNMTARTGQAEQDRQAEKDRKNRTG